MLRAPADDDAAVLHDYFRRNEPRFARWDPDYTDDVTKYRGWIAGRRLEIAADRGRSFLAFERTQPDVLAALVNLYAIRGAPLYDAVMGYSVDGAYEGRGFAREAVAAVVRYAFDELRLHRIVANYDPANERSGGLLRRLGFVVEGYARDLLYLRGRWRDHVTTALLNPAWEPPR